MNGGKLPPAILQSLILDHIQNKNPDVLVHAGLGEDSAIVDFGEYVCALSVDPVTGADRGAGWLAVHVSCNDVASNGTRPVGVLISVLCPERDHKRILMTIVTDTERAARELGIEILGGHTEIMPDLPRPVITVTAVGKAPKGRFVTSAGARPGDQIVLTKGAGIEGTAILAQDYGEALANMLPHEVIERARAFTNLISVVKEGLLAAEAGVRAMHDVTEGGVLGALYEMAQASGVGLEIEAARVPVREETRLVCEALGADPLLLISSGAMLIATPNGEELWGLLKSHGIEAAVIGRVTEGQSRVLITEDGQIPIQPPDGDELWRVRALLDSPDGQPGKPGKVV